jgi:hypothetical protein
MGKKLKNVLCGILAAAIVVAGTYPGSISAAANRAIAIPVVFNNTTGSSAADIEARSSSFCDIDLKSSMKLSDSITMNYWVYIPKKLFSTDTSIVINPTLYAEYSTSAAVSADSYDGYFYVENAIGGITVKQENGSYQAYDYASSAEELSISKYATVSVRGNYVRIRVEKMPMLGTSSNYYLEGSGSEDSDGAAVNDPKAISEILGNKKAKCRINLSMYGYNTTAKGTIYFDVVTVLSGSSSIHTNFNTTSEIYSYEIGTEVSVADLSPSLMNITDTQTLTTAFTTRTYTVSQLRRAKQTARIGAKASTAISYKVLNGSKYLSVKNGTVTIKKNTPKGTYKIQVTAKAQYNYSKKTKTITIRVK